MVDISAIYQAIIVIFSVHLPVWYLYISLEVILIQQPGELENII